jgi:hypothetical protein
MALHAQQDVGEVVDRVHLVRLARRDERVESGQVLAGVVVPDEEEVLAPESESPFILPISVKSPWCTTAGTRSSARPSRSRTANVVAEKTSR